MNRLVLESAPLPLSSAEEAAEAIAIGKGALSFAFASPSPPISPPISFTIVAAVLPLPLGAVGEVVGASATAVFEFPSGPAAAEIDLALSIVSLYLRATFKAYAGVSGGVRGECAVAGAGFVVVVVGDLGRVGLEFVSELELELCIGIWRGNFWLVFVEYGRLELEGENNPVFRARRTGRFCPA